NSTIVCDFPRKDRSQFEASHVRSESFDASIQLASLWPRPRRARRQAVGPLSPDQRQHRVDLSCYGGHKVPCCGTEASVRKRVTRSTAQALRGSAPCAWPCQTTKVPDGSDCAVRLVPSA